MVSRKFDFPSGSPVRPMYNTGQRGSSLAAQLNRSGSFRESMENPVLASVPITSRSNSVIPNGDVSSFFQCLRFDPKVIAADHKSNRQGEYKRDINAALGITDDDSPPGSIRAKMPLSLSPEEIKRFRTGLRESVVKARERVKIFNEALSVFNKFFPSIPSKKRSRSGGISGDRSTALLASDRSFLGPAISKMGIQNHGISGSFEFEPETSEERPKNAVPNKRMRTSLVDTRMDGRNNPTVKPSVSVEREREMLRVANGGLILGEDRTLPIGVDGWERSKTKKKRSGIKSDTSPSCIPSHRPAQGNRETKQGLTQRAVMEARSRSNNESNGVRPQISNGIMGLGKSDCIPQQTGLSKRPFIPRTETDNLTNDRRESPVGSEKERLGLRSINKVSGNDESNSSSPTSTAKINGSLRGFRSGSSVVPKLSPVMHKASPPSEWELSHCTGKPPTAGGANNRKRNPAIQSASPPVAHWSGQRPQKISRTARRTNFAPIISNHEEAQSLDSVSDVPGNEISSGIPRQFPASSQQLKLKGDSLSSVAPSESEDSGAAEIVSKEKPKKSGRIDNKSPHNVQKVSHLILSSRKNNLPVGEDLGDGVRRQGRTGRGYASTRALMPMSIEKVGNVGPTKQLRSGKLGLDKAESKAGRPPTRKLSDRKSYARQKHMGNTAAVVLSGSDDGHADLVAAVNAVINSAHSFSSSFWRQMEPYLGFISDRDIAFLKQQVECDSSQQMPMPVPSIAIPSGCNSTDPERNWSDAAEKMRFDFFPQHLVLDDKNSDMVPLYQRLLAALISEEDHVVGSEERNIDIYRTGFQLDVELGSKCLSDVANSLSAGDNVNGYWSTRRQEHDDPEIHLGYRSTKKMGHANPQIDMLENAVDSNDGHSLNSMLSDSTFLPGTVSTDFQYEGMNINEKILLEAQSIGIFLDPMPDVFEMEDDRIFEDIVKLEEQHCEQVSKKKGLLSKLLKAVLVTREIQEKEFEKHALDALVTLVYKKYLAYWGRNATVGKNSSSKMFKQAALAIVKRTLERCHEFEDTGSICFSEPLFKNMFSSSFSQSKALPDTESLEPNNALKVRVSAPTGTQATASSKPSLVQSGGVKIDSFDLILPENQLSDSIGKEDASFGRVTKRELLLDDVVGGSFGSSNSHSGLGSPLSSSTKGKRSERDRDVKGHGRETLSRKATNKIGRTVSNAKGERKLKTKPKQKTTQLSVSVNGLISDQPKPTASVLKPTHMTVKNSSKEKDEFSLDVLDDPADDLQMPGQDISSWLNIEDDALQDDDIVGLEIPMDDLSDLNMMV